MQTVEKNRPIVQNGLDIIEKAKLVTMSIGNKKHQSSATLMLNKIISTQKNKELALSQHLD